MNNAFRHPGGAGRVKDKERVFGVHLFRRAIGADLLGHFVKPHVAALDHGDIAAGAVSLEELDSDLLPAPMQAMSSVERAELVADTARKRADLADRIQTLKGQRDDYLAAQVEGSVVKEESLDYQLFDAVREQAKQKGLSYAAEPSL